MGDEKEKHFVNRSEEIIVSDILYFIRNKLKSTAVRIIATTCHQFYSDDEYVFSEKKKLCEATDEYCNQRRTEDKRLKNIEDICAIISNRDTKNEYLPQFASLDLNNVPVNDDGNPSLGQIMASLYDLRKKVVSKDELHVTLNELKREFSSSSLPLYPSNESSRLPSAPPLPLSPSAPGLSQSPAPSMNEAVVSLSTVSTDNFITPRTPSPRRDAWQVAGSARHRTSGSASTSESTASASGPTPVAVAPQRPPASALGNSNSSLLSGADRRPRKDEKRRNNKSRQRNFSRPRTIIGKNVNDGLTSVKGADLTVNRYVGRWHNDTTVDAVKEFITKQNVTVVELVDLETRHGRFKSFRLRIKKIQLPTIEDENFWPAGVILSPFFRGKDEKQIGAGAASAPSSNG